MLPPSTAFQPGGYAGTCPVCHGPALQSDRYPRALCEPCTNAAVCEEHGQPVALGAQQPQLSGLEPGHWLDGGRWTPCGERVVVHGVPCIYHEAYMGGGVAQPVTGTLEPLARDLGLVFRSDFKPGWSDEYVYSDDSPPTYRYAFARWWGEPDLARAVVWVLLNPATGDTEQRHRPTLDRCVTWSKGWGATGLVVLNLFAFRHTDPKKLLTAADPIGPCNDRVLAAVKGARTVAAWGADGRIRQRSAEVARLLHEPMCLGTTQGGEPRHPLYIPATAELQPWP
jgi:hypothetical protein